LHGVRTESSTAKEVKIAFHESAVVTVKSVRKELKKFSKFI
jgi:hypothetical protein